MPECAPSPSIEVTIGGQQRVYHAFVTTAPPALDGASTVTLHASTLSDVCGFAADPIVYDTATGKTVARLVLIETQDLEPQRAKCKAAHCLCAPADPVLVSLRTLQYWLWLRLQAFNASEVHA